MRGRHGRRARASGTAHVARQLHPVDARAGVVATPLRILNFYLKRVKEDANYTSSGIQADGRSRNFANTWIGEKSKRANTQAHVQQTNSVSLKRLGRRRYGVKLRQREEGLRRMFSVNIILAS
ncbi:hypothetical protein EVAR_7985_1 [Eumeta japonica]|uniref:Uncharacterized protein n=1 Tax=Eumeta variegata TaxID=151549 RepID=A0A4C1TGY7_EUMVA|nr:hypothetical protein EVAR_7985_1 [Eumeta japonica]